MEWKTFVFNGHKSVWLYHLTWFALNSQFRSVKEINSKIASGKRFEKGDFFFHQEIGSLSLKELMRLLVYDDDDISCLLIRMLIRLSMENIFFTMWGTLIDIGLKDLFLLDNLLTITVFALVGFVDRLT